MVSFEDISMHIGMAQASLRDFVPQWVRYLVLRRAALVFGEKVCTIQAPSGGKHRLALEKGRGGGGGS